MKKYFLVFFMTVYISVSLFAQLQDSDVFGVIIYATGSQVSIFRQGNLMQYNILVDDIIGLPLLEGDMVQTEDNSFIEIQFIPGENIIKVAENTSFEITNMGNAGGGNFELLYGRIRANVSQLGDYDGFSLRSRSAVAQFNETDLLFDYVVSRENFDIPETTVYCFEGSVEVSGTAGALESDEDYGQNGQETGEGTMVISAQEMVTVFEEQTFEGRQGSHPVNTRMEVRGITSKITSYWEEHGFKASAVKPGDIEKVFPDMASKLSEARNQANFAAEKSAFLESGKSMQEIHGEETDALQLSGQYYEPIQAIGMSDILKNIEVEAYQVQSLTISGAVCSILGGLVGSAGVILNYFSKEVGLDSVFGKTYGPVFMAAGGVSLTTGILSFIFGSGK